MLTQPPIVHPIEQLEYGEVKHPVKFGTKNSMTKSESTSGFKLLTRATSFMTWDTTGSSSKAKQTYDDDEEAQMFPTLLKKHSIHSFSGITILPTIYGSTNKHEDDNISECSYVTGVSAHVDLDDDSNLSFESVSSDKNNVHEYGIKNVFLKELKTEDPPSRTHHIREADESIHMFTVLVNNIMSSSVMVQTKSNGVTRHQSAPHFPLSECIWTFTGSFAIIFLLCFLSSNITLWNDHGHAFPLGPFGALTTLQYSLVDAAPAQPRNVILGSTLSGCVALWSTYIPETILSSTLRIALATSSSISLMAAFGIMHPPGGAIALVFAMGHYHWGHLLLTLIGCWIAVFLATVINNLNPHRQYPQYWNFAAPFEKL